MGKTRIPREVGEEAEVDKAPEVEEQLAVGTLHYCFDFQTGEVELLQTVSICRPSSEASLTVSSKLKRRCSSSTVGTLGNCFDCQPASYSLKIRLPDETEIASSVGPLKDCPYSSI